MADAVDSSPSPAEDPLATRILPVARMRAHEEVARQLRELMQRGELRPNDRLPPERELAKRFGVSRATVRQALSVLQAAGLVESQVGSGTYTRDGSAVLNVTTLADALRAAGASLVEQLELRRILEPQVASLAAERATDEAIKALEACLADQRAHASDPGFIVADSAFHHEIARATGNSLLVKMVEGIHELLHESRELSWKAQGGDAPIIEHERIAEAINKHDADAAYEAMMAHMLSVERHSLAEFAAKSPPGARSAANDRP